MTLACAAPRYALGPIFKQGTVPRLRLPSAAVPYNDIVTGGQPTKESLIGAARAGVRTVIDLRTEAENPPHKTELRWARDNRMDYIRLPIEHEDGLTRKNVEKFAKLMRKADHPLLIHCDTSERTGAMIALRAFFVLGRSAEDSVAVGRVAGLKDYELFVRERVAGGRLRNKGKKK